MVVVATMIHFQPKNNGDNVMKIIESKISVNTETKTFTLGITIGTDGYTQTYAFTGGDPFKCIQDIRETIDCLHGSELGDKVYHELYTKYADHPYFEAHGEHQADRT